MPANSNAPTAPREVMNVPEAADYLRVAASTIWKKIYEGKLKPFRVGDRVLFRRSYLDSLDSVK